MASAAVTRMLVLGVVSLFQPMNGYQLLRELNSWQVEEWAQVKPGSIYSMLNTLSKQKKLLRHELAEAERAVAVYEVSESGATEFARLVRAGLDGSAGLNQVMFQAAMSFSPALPRSEVIEAIRRRLVQVGEKREALVTKIGTDEVPPHVRHVATLEYQLVEAERAWVAEFISMLEGGYLWFAGEPGDVWQPPPDDAGWEMVAQAERYRRLLEQQQDRRDIQT